MTPNGTIQEAAMTAISTGLNRDRPLTPAVARARTATVAVWLMITNAATIRRAESPGPW